LFFLAKLFALFIFSLYVGNVEKGRKDMENNQTMKFLRHSRQIRQMINWYMLFNSILSDLININVIE